MGLKLLFICTGNTCRSPMAEGLARKMFGDSVQVGSAGMVTYGGESANTHALEVLKKHNVDLSGHLSRRIGAELMADANWIIPMTKAQEVALKRHFPQYAEKTRSLGDWGDQEWDVLDPWGGSLDVYLQTAQEIENLLSTIKSYLDL